MTNKTPVVASADGTKHETLGSGDTLSPVSIPVSAKSGNSLSREDDGLFVAGGGSGGGGGGLESVAVGNGLTGNGTAGSPINVKLSKGTGNTATVTDDGLFVPASGGSSSVVAGVTMQGDGTASDPLEIYFSSQKNNVAGVGPFNSGLFVPAPMSGFDTDGTSGTEGAHPAPGSVIITNEGLSDKTAFIGVRLSKRAGNALSLITPDDSDTEKGLYAVAGGLPAMPAQTLGDIITPGDFQMKISDAMYTTTIPDSPVTNKWGMTIDIVGGVTAYLSIIPVAGQGVYVAACGYTEDDTLTNQLFYVPIANGEAGQPTYLVDQATKLAVPGAGLQGRGTSSSPLEVLLATTSGNAVSFGDGGGLYVAPAPKTGDIAYQGILSVNTQESVGSDFTAAQAFKVNANGTWQMKNTVMLDPLPSRFTKGISVNAYLDKIPCDADGVPLIYNLSTKTVSKQVNGAFRQHVVYMLTIMGTPAKIMDITTGVLTDYANNTASMQVVVYYNVTQRTDVPSA